LGGAGHRRRRWTRLRSLVVRQGHLRTARIAIDRGLGNKVAAREEDPHEKARRLVNWYKAAGYGQNRAIELAFGEIYGK